MARKTRSGTQTRVHVLSAMLAVFSLCCLLVAFQGKAWGYVDPGSGFIALQTFASVAAAGGYFLRRRIRALFGGRSGDDAPVAPAPAETAKRNLPPIELKDGSSQGRA